MIGRVLLIFFALAISAAAAVVTCQSREFRKIADDTRYLEPREFASLTAITVGTGTAYENPHRLGPSTGVGVGSRVVLVDAGRALSEALRAAKISPSQPDTVFLTNLMPENTVGLDDLLLTGWLHGREVPLTLVGPEGTNAFAEGMLRFHAAGIKARADTLGLPLAGASIQTREIEDGWSASSGDLEVIAAALPDGPLPALAYRFQAHGTSLVVGGTGWGAERLTQLARGADALVHDAFWADSVELAIQSGADDPERIRREAALLTSLQSAGEIAEAAGVRALILTRLRPPPLHDFQYTQPVGEVYSGQILVATDGETFTLGRAQPASTSE